MTSSCVVKRPNSGVFLASAWLVIFRATVLQRERLGEESFRTSRMPLYSEGRRCELGATTCDRCGRRCRLVAHRLVLRGRLDSSAPLLSRNLASGCRRESDCSVR
jgi:hypothetical protein